MLNVAAQCHLNGVVHRDMKPEVGTCTSSTTCAAIMWMRTKEYVDYQCTECQVHWWQSSQNDESLPFFFRTFFSNLQKRIRLWRQRILGYLTLSNQVQQHHLLGVLFFPFLLIHLALDGMFCTWQVHRSLSVLKVACWDWSHWLISWYPFCFLQAKDSMMWWVVHTTLLQRCWRENQAQSLMHGVLVSSHTSCCVEGAHFGRRLKLASLTR